MTTYGAFGRDYSRELNSTDGPIPGYRREKVFTTIVGGQEVTVTVRDTIVPEDPYLNMVRAAAYVYQTGKNVFPVPPTSKTIKDTLIKTIILI